MTPADFVSGHDHGKSMKLPSPNQMIQCADLSVNGYRYKNKIALSACV
jgi:hypothetical protein